MSRIIDAPITVTQGPGTDELVPTSFRYRGGIYRIKEILDTWMMLAGQWWEDPAAVGRAPAQDRYWRVRTTDGGVYELTESETHQWRLYKAYD